MIFQNGILKETISGMRQTTSCDMNEKGANAAKKNEKRSRVETGNTAAVRCETKSLENKKKGTNALLMYG